MRSKIVRIGNSRGIRLPKVLLEEAGISGTEEVQLSVERDKLVIMPLRRVRQGWREAFAHARAEKLLDAPMPTRFDEEEWSW